MNTVRIRTVVALTALLLTMSAGAGAQRAGGPGEANESAQLPALTAPVRIAADFTIKAIQTDSLGASYPRVIQLHHYAPGKGQLLVTFAGGGSGAGMPVYRSADNGETFHFLSERNPKAPGGAEFVPELIHNRSGTGSDVYPVDLNKDGRLDVVTATRFGTFIFWNNVKR